MVSLFFNCENFGFGREFWVAFKAGGLYKEGFNNICFEKYLNLEIIKFSDWLFVYPIGRKFPIFIFVVGVFSWNFYYIIQWHIKIFCHFFKAWYFFNYYWIRVLYLNKHFKLILNNRISKFFNSIDLTKKNGWEKNTLSHITFTKKFYHILIIF